MSEKKKKNSTVIEAFGGIDHTKSYGDIFSARNIENFRILNNGSLEKRCGYKFLRYLGEPVRAIYTCHINGEDTLFALISNLVYAISLEDNSSREIGAVNTVSGNACFFFFRERLYLLDGEAVYEYSGGAFVNVVGYVPLIAKNWPTNIIGEINEPRNILNRHARATYDIDMDSLYLCTVDLVDSVEALYVNGLLMPPEMYRIDDRFSTINVQDLTKGDKVEIFFTYKEGHDDLLARLCSCVSSALFGGIGKNRIFLCGDNGTGTVFSSKNVSASDIQQSKRFYPESGELYFPVGYEFEAGDGVSEIQAISRFYDHVLIFTESDVWMLTPDDEGRDFASTTSVNARIGCPVTDGAVLSENEPVSIGYRSLFSWKTGGNGKLDAVNISYPIDDMLDEEFLQGCGIYYDVSRNELWLYHKERPIIWIYNTVRGAWYSFTGIIAERMFDINGNVAFIRDGCLYVLDDDCFEDIEADGSKTPITATYSSNYSELGVLNNKNLSSVTLCAELFGDTMRFELDAPPYKLKEYDIFPSEDDGYSTTSFRCSAERFKHASFSVISQGIKRQKIHSLTLHMR